MNVTPRSTPAPVVATTSPRGRPRHRWSPRRSESRPWLLRLTTRPVPTAWQEKATRVVRQATPLDTPIGAETAWL